MLARNSKGLVRCDGVQEAQRVAVTARSDADEVDRAGGRQHIEVVVGAVVARIGNARNGSERTLQIP